MPSLNIIPNPAPAGTTVDVTGAGFNPKYKFALTTTTGSDEVGLTTNTNRPKRDGSFAVGINLPSTAGTTIIKAYQQSVVVAQVSVTVQAPPSTAISISDNLSAGATLTGKVIWSATVSNGTVPSVDFLIDGTVAWTEMSAPYVFNGDPSGTLDTATLADGAHTLTVRANAPTPATHSETVTISNGTTPPVTPPSIEFTEIYRETFDKPAAEGQFFTVYPKLQAYPLGWKDSSKNGTYDPSIVSAHDGVADVYIRTTNGTHRVLSFGPVIDTDKYQKYGAYEIGWKADSMHGYKAAWLLWPKSEVWPRDGEIDFPEGDFDGHVSAFMHRQGATSGSDQDAFNSGVAMAGAWHTARLEWTPTRCEFFLDGKSIGKATSRIPNTEMRWQIQCETTLSGFTPADSVSGHVLIDHIAVSKWNG